ncbi:type II secretion system protein GspM [Puniceibacterium confluentis]|uniref:type II secretion system protein GspM n=1 Tax=Puniceibacterium confluentis TaxID=1958944 RepID=UPI0011B44B80|nr:type II secretion system protein GspM [Puniceibacterium confluentis]
MSARLIDLLARLAPRERVLLAVLVLGVLPAALWFAVLEPLATRRVAAEAELREARALAGWVSARAGELAALDQGDSTGPRAPVGLSAVEQSLISAELRGAVSELSNRTGGGIELRFETVAFADLMHWLSAQDPGWGYDIDAFRLRAATAAGEVAAELRLMPQD